MKHAPNDPSRFARPCCLVFTRPPEGPDRSGPAVASSCIDGQLPRKTLNSYQHNAAKVEHPKEWEFIQALSSKTLGIPWQPVQHVCLARLAFAIQRTDRLMSVWASSGAMLGSSLSTLQHGRSSAGVSVAVRVLSLFRKILHVEVLGAWRS